MEEGRSASVCFPPKRPMRPAASLLTLNQPRLLEFAHVERQGGLADPQCVGQVAGTHCSFPGVGQVAQHPDAAGVTERLEHCGELIGVVVRKQGAIRARTTGVGFVDLERSGGCLHRPMLLDIDESRSDHSPL